VSAPHVQSSFLVPEGFELRDRVKQVSQWEIIKHTCESFTRTWDYRNSVHQVYTDSRS
jgi:hypothetical protein